MVAIRTFQHHGFGEAVLFRGEPCPADLAHQLTGFSVVTVQIRVRGLTAWAGTLFGDIARRATLYRVDRLAVLPGVIAVKILPVPVLLPENDPWELIHLELLVFRRMGVFESPLFKRDVFTDKMIAASKG